MIMEHVAIMRRSWGLTRKILSGEKTIESRWYMSRRPPWDAVHQGDLIYFKDSGEPVSVAARVARVMQFSDLGSREVAGILKKYGSAAGIEGPDLRKFYERFKEKRYCILVFLKDARGVDPFYIDKEGFGVMSAWITVDDVGKIRK
jgi:ASC-1-like (ASCH) protein